MQGAWQTPRSTWRRLAPELTHRSRIPPRPRGKRLLPVRCGHERRRVHVARQLQQSRAAGGASAADDDSASFVDLPRVWLVNNLARKLDTCSAPEAQPAKLPTPAEQVQLGLAAPPGSVEPKATQGGERTGGDVNEVLTTMTSGNGGEGSLGVGGGGKELAQVLVGIDAFVQRGYAAVLARMQDEFAVLDPTANAWRGRQTRWEEVEAPFLASTFAVALRSDYSLLSRSEAEFVEATQNSKSLPIEIEWNNIQGGLLRFANPFEATGVDPPPFADRLLVFHRGVGVRRVRGYFYAEKMDELFSRATEWLRSVILTPPSRALARLLRVEHTGEVEARKEQPHERTGVADLPLGFRQVLRQVELVEPTFRSVILVWRESESITGTQTALLRFAVAAHNRLLRVTAKVASAAKTVALHSEDLANESTTRVGKKLARGAHSVTKRARRLTKRVRNKVASADAITLLGGRVRVPFRPDGQAVLHWKGHGHYGADDADEQESGMWGDDAGGLDGDDTVAAWVPTTTRDANSNAEKYGTFALYDHPLVQQAIENAQELADEKESSSATSHQVDADWESLKRVRIFVKELKDVPMSELKLAFPHLRLAMSALDKLRLSFLGGACGLSGWHLISEETVVSTTAVVALTSFVVVSMRLWFRYNVARVYCKHRVVEQNVESFASRDAATVASLVGEAGEFEAKAAMLVYSCMVTPMSVSEGSIGAEEVRLPELTLEEVSERVEVLLREACQTEEPFSVDDATAGVRTLRHLGLVAAVGDSAGTCDDDDDAGVPTASRFKAIGLDQALPQLEHAWRFTLGTRQQP